MRVWVLFLSFSFLEAKKIIIRFVFSFSSSSFVRCCLDSGIHPFRLRFLCFFLNLCSFRILLFVCKNFHCNSLLEMSINRIMEFHTLWKPSTNDIVAHTRERVRVIDTNLQNVSFIHFFLLRFFCYKFFIINFLIHIDSLVTVAPKIMILMCSNHHWFVWLHSPTIWIMWKLHQWQAKKYSTMPVLNIYIHSLTR